MIMFHCYPLLRQSDLKLNKRDLNYWNGSRNVGWVFVEHFVLSDISFSTLDIEVSIEDLLNPPPQAVKNHSLGRPGRTTSLSRLASSHHPHTLKLNTENDVASSMRVSMLSRSMRVSDMSGVETRGFFVRSQQVLYLLMLLVPIFEIPFSLLIYML